MTRQTGKGRIVTTVTIKPESLERLRQMGIRPGEAVDRFLILLDGISERNTRIGDLENELARMTSTSRNFSERIIELERRIAGFEGGTHG